LRCVTSGTVSAQLGPMRQTSRRRLLLTRASLRPLTLRIARGGGGEAVETGPHAPSVGEALCPLTDSRTDTEGHCATA
jgi:hypothetical protein